MSKSDPLIDYRPTLPTHLTVKGAYGRDYSDEYSAVADWVDNKDFKVLGLNFSGNYVNKQQARKLKTQLNIVFVRIRFNNQEEYTDIQL